MSEDRVVVITGSSTRLGAATIKDFAARGFGVCINYIVEGDAEAVYNEVLEVTDESKPRVFTPGELEDLKLGGRTSRYRKRR